MWLYLSALCQQTGHSSHLPLGVQQSAPGAVPGTGVTLLLAAGRHPRYTQSQTGMRSRSVPAPSFIINPRSLWRETHRNKAQENTAVCPGQVLAVLGGRCRASALSEALLESLSLVGDSVDECPAGFISL